MCLLQGFGCEALASLLSGIRRYRYAPCKPQFSALFRSLFAPRATAFGSSGGRPGWLRPGRSLAALVLAAGALAARPLQASIFGSFSVPFLHPGLARAPWLAAPWPCLSCSCACCRALAARPWRVFLVGFEGTVKHPPGRPGCSCACCRALAARPLQAFFGPFWNLAGCALAVP